MARRKQDSVCIPEVDIIKSGLESGDRYSDIRDDDGYIPVSRDKTSLKVREEIYKNQLAEEESRLNKLREKLNDIHGEDIDTTDVVADSDMDELKEEYSKLKKKKKKGTISNKEKKRLKEVKNLIEKNTPSFEDGLIKSSSSELASFILASKKGKKKKGSIFDRKDDEEYDDDIHGLKKKEKRKGGSILKKKNGEEKDEEKKIDEVEESFKVIDKLSNENIKSIDETMKVVDKEIAEIRKATSRIRGRDTAMANYIQAKASLISSKQATINNMASVKVKKFDIKMKKEKNSSEASSATSHADTIARLFPAMMKNPKLAAQASEAMMATNKGEKKKKKGKFRGDESILAKREKELLDSGDIAYNIYDKNIELEGKYTIVVKKSFETQEWKFAAVDKHGKFIEVPKKLLPKRSSVRLRFDDEKDKAKDEISLTIYDVYNMPAI